MNNTLQPESRKVYTEQFRLSAADANAQQEMSIPQLISRFIDLATNHANLLGIGNPNMKGLGGGWVLSRLSYEAVRYPKANEFYSISTWVEDWNRHFSSRCFALEDEQGNVLIQARTIWMIIDLENHTNLGLSHFQCSPSDLIAENMVCPIAKQLKHKKIAAPGTMDTDDLVAQTQSMYTFKYCDIDFYRHVNTVRYVVLLLNQFPMELFDRKIASRFELSFLHEAKYAMTVALRRVDSDCVSSLSLTDISNPAGNPLLYSRIKFTDR